MTSRVTITNSDPDGKHSIHIDLVVTSADGSSAIESFIDLEPGERHTVYVRQFRHLVITENQPKSVLQETKKAAE